MRNRFDGNDEDNDPMRMKFISSQITSARDVKDISDYQQKVRAKNRLAEEESRKRQKVAELRYEKSERDKVVGI